MFTPVKENMNNERGALIKAPLFVLMINEIDIFSIPVLIKVLSPA
jgi:hypothetical protein